MNESERIDMEIEQTIDNIHQFPKSSIDWFTGLDRRFLDRYGSKTRLGLIEDIMLKCGIRVSEISGRGFAKEGFKKMGLLKILSKLGEDEQKER